MAATGTGVTIGSRTVRILQVRRQKAGTWQVLRALTSPIGAEDPSDSQRVAEARAAAQTAQAKGDALIGLSGRDLIVRYTQVPPVPDWRLDMLMNFEIQEVAEQSGGDVSADYVLLDVDDTTSGDNVVLVSLAKNGYLNPRLQALSSAGMRVLGGAPRAMGAYWSYRENGHLRHDETVLIMHIGHENTDVAIARKGALLFARNVSGGSNKFTDILMQNMGVPFATAEKMKVRKGNLTPRGLAKYRDSAEEKIANHMMSVGGHFVSAFNSSVMFAKAQTKVPDCQPDRMVLMGAGAQLRGLPEYLESSLGIPVELFDPFDDLDLSSLADDAREMLRQDQGAMAATLGLAQMAADASATRVTVLPEADKKKRHFQEHTLFLLLSAGVMVAALVVAFVMLGGAHSQGVDQRAELQSVQSDATERSARYQAAREVVADRNLEKRRLRTRGALGPAYVEITDLVQGVLERGEFDEIFFPKVSAQMRDVKVGEGDEGAIRRYVPVVEFEASVEPKGGARTSESAYTEFNSMLKSVVGGVGYLDHQEVGALEAGRTFKFRITQLQFPKEYAERAAEGGAE